jgi:hypothetical protein
MGIAVGSPGGGMGKDSRQRDKLKAFSLCNIAVAKGSDYNLFSNKIMLRLFLFTYYIGGKEIDETRKSAK